MEQAEQIPVAEAEPENLSRIRGTSVEDLQSMDYYERLGVSRDATKEDIQAAFKEIAPGLHPDTPGTSPEDEERLKLITEARAELKDATKRAAYDLRNPVRQQRQGSQEGQPASTNDAARAAAARDGMDEFMRYGQETTARYEAERAAQAERVRRENEAYWKKYNADREAELQKVRAQEEQRRQEEERARREQEKRKAENAVEAERILKQYEADFSALLDSAELKVASIRAELEQIRKGLADIKTERDEAFAYAVGVNWSELLRPKKTDERRREFRDREEALRKRKWELHEACQKLSSEIKAFVDQSEKITLNHYVKDGWRSELFMNFRYGDRSAFFDEEDHARLAEEYKKIQTSVGGRRTHLEGDIWKLDTSIIG